MSNSLLIGSFICCVGMATGRNTSTTVPSRVVPDLLEIFMPSVAIILTCATGIILLLGCKYEQCIKRLKLRQKVCNIDFELYHIQTFKGNVCNGNNDHKNIISAFLTPFDLEVLRGLRNFTNTPRELLYITIPSLVTICLGPVTMLFYHSTTQWFWPIEKFPKLPNNNQCVACFLTPAGLVYAISFGFAFSSALTKQGDILTKVTGEISYLDQTATLASKLKIQDKRTRMDVYLAIKSEAIYMILQVLNKKSSSFQNKPTTDVKTAIWDVLGLLREANQSSGDSIDNIMIRYIIEYISTLNNICSDDLSVLHSRTHWLMWVFLITLGFFSLYGVLMIQAFSYRMELMMSTLTLFSITMLCYIVADLDSPFSGFFRIDISIIVDVIYRLEVMYKMAALGFEETVCYPDSSRFKEKRYSIKNQPETDKGLYLQHIL